MRMWAGITCTAVCLAALSIAAGARPAAAETAEALYSRGQKSLDREAYQEAVELFHEVARRHPKSKFAANALYYKAFALYRLGDTESLETAYESLTAQKELYPEASTAGDGSALLVRIEGELARRGDGEAAMRLAEKAKEQDEETRAARRKEGKGDRPSGDDDDLRMEALNALLQMDERKALPILRKILLKRDEKSLEMRKKAVFLVAQQESEETITILSEVIRNDPDPEVREQAVFWLSQVPGEESVDILIQILKSGEHPELKEKAIFALSQHESPRAAEGLKAAVLDEKLSESVREQAIFWLGQADGPGTVPFLRELYGRVSSPALKEKIIFSISQTGSGEAKAWLLSVARDGSEDVEMRKKALFWLSQEGSLTRSELDQLWGEFGDREMKEQIVFILSQQGDRAAIDKLIEIARRDPDREVRKKAVFWLGQTDDEAALRFLEELIDR